MDFDPARSVLSMGAVFHGRYEVVRCLKNGGMGAIYEVIHIETRRRRALKLMLPSIVANVDMHARFKLEATVAADIESEHIVETFDAGVDKDTGVPFLVMELLRGEDLDAVSQKRGPLPASEVVLMLAQTASALDKTHAAGVVHRDLKPENLFVARRDDGSPKIKILDFGIAKVVSESGQPAAKTKVLGTPLYMSPEQIRGDGTIGPRADLYALTHIAFTLLTGQPYWGDEARADQLYAMMMKIVAGSDVSATTMGAKFGVTLPASFDPWFKKGTAVVPQERFATASELVEALGEALAVPITRLSITGGNGEPIPIAASRSVVSSPNLAGVAMGNPTPTAITPVHPEPTRVLPDALPPVAGVTGGSTTASPSGSLNAGSVSQPIPQPPTKGSRVGVIVGAVIALVVLGVIGSRLVSHPDPDAPSSSAKAAPIGAADPPAVSSPTVAVQAPTVTPSAAVPSAQPSAGIAAAADRVKPPSTSTPLVTHGGVIPRPSGTPGAKLPSTPTATPTRSLD